ncbi:hypothetical protein [Romboutsia hominis]|nr:hypothetical protein [Romboutsia hominis]
MNHLTILIKPSSSACNLDCKYCFYKDISKIGMFILMILWIFLH